MWPLGTYVAKYSKSTNFPALPYHTTASESAVHGVSNVCNFMTTGTLSIESVYTKIPANHLILHPNLNLSFP